MRKILCGEKLLWLLFKSKINYIFAIADRLAEAPVRGQSGRESVATHRKCVCNYILEKRLSALILGVLKFSQSFIFMSRIEQR